MPTKKQPLRLPAPRALQGVTIARGSLRVEVPAAPMKRPTIKALRALLDKWDAFAKEKLAEAEALGLRAGVHSEGISDGTEHCVRELRALLKNGEVE